MTRNRFHMFDTEADLRGRLRILKSDLADTNNPKVLAKYPHLDNEDLREQLRTKIASIEEKLKK